MEIKQKPPSDLEIAEAVAEMQSGLVKDTELLRETVRMAYLIPKSKPVWKTLPDMRTRDEFDHRNATAPCDPIAVHGEGE